MKKDYYDIINKLVWFIPFKKVRDTFRNFLSIILSNQNLILDNQKIILDNQSRFNNQKYNCGHILDKLEELVSIEMENNNNLMNYITLLKKELLENIKNEKPKKKVVYTCVTNNYDNLLIHSYIDNEWDYICFTDNTYMIDKGFYGNWKIEKLKFDKVDNTRINRWHKMHPHILFENYEESLWIDTNIDLKTKYIFERIRSFRDNNIKFAISKHCERDCIYKEAEIIINDKIDDSNIVNTQLEMYRKEGFPEKYGLTDNSILYRNHNDSEIILIMEYWWYIISNYSKRDQLSLFYILWKYNYKIEYLTEIPTRFDIYNFDFRKHNHQLINKSLTLEDLIRRFQRNI